MRKCNTNDFCLSKCYCCAVALAEISFFDMNNFLAVLPLFLVKEISRNVDNTLLLEQSPTTSVSKQPFFYK